MMRNNLLNTTCQKCKEKTKIVFLVDTNGPVLTPAVTTNQEVVWAVVATKEQDYPAVGHIVEEPHTWLCVNCLRSKLVKTD